MGHTISVLTLEQLKYTIAYQILAFSIMYVENLKRSPETGLLNLQRPSYNNRIVWNTIYIL